MRPAICLVLVGLTFPVVAGAEPITYSEALHGDLGQLLAPGEPGTPTIFALDVGLNTFTGTLSLGPGPDNRDLDSIAFSVPAGTQLATVSYSIQAVFVGGARGGSSFFALAPSNLLPGTNLALLGVHSFVGDDVQEGTAFASALPLGSGSYGIAHYGFGFDYDGRFASAFSQNYQWTLRVEPGTPPPPVPEPATWLLIASGAAAVVRKGRNRRCAGAQPRPS